MKAERRSKTILAGLVLFLVFAPIAHAGMLLSPGDIVVANFINVVVIDPLTGDVTEVACCFSGATGIAIDSDGDIIVSDRTTGDIFRIDPETGTTTTISSGGLLLHPYGIAIAANGDILVVDPAECCVPNSGSVVRVNPTTGAQTLVSTGGDFVDPIGIEVEADGSILVADFNARKLFRIDPTTGTQTTVASFVPNGNPYDAAVAADGTIFIVDPLERAVIKVDPATGDKTTISSRGFFDQPGGIAVENIESVLITDFTESTVVRVDLVTGSQTIIASGVPDVANPIGIAVVAAAILTVAIDIKPSSDPNSVNPRNRGRIPVGILSSTTFNALIDVIVSSLTFGPTGDEQSLSFCNLSPEDVNGDGFDDLVCYFNTQEAGFVEGDTEGVVKVETPSGQAAEGRDSVRIVGGSGGRTPGPPSLYVQPADHLSSSLSVQWWPQITADNSVLRPPETTRPGSWTGVYRFVGAPPSPADDNFTIFFFEDDDGLPAVTPFASYAVGSDVSRTSTGFAVSGDDEFGYVATIPATPLEAGTPYHLAIWNGVFSQAGWAWASGAAADTLHFIKRAFPTSTSPWTQGAEMSHSFALRQTP